MTQAQTSFLDLNPNKYGEKDDVEYEFEMPKGLSEEVVRKISALKKEPAWMLAFRLKALAHFFERQMPKWGADLKNIDFDNITYYLKAKGGNSTKWEDVPANIKKTFEKLGNRVGNRRSLVFDILETAYGRNKIEIGIAQVNDLLLIDACFEFYFETSRLIERWKINHLVAVVRGIVLQMPFRSVYSH